MNRVVIDISICPTKMDADQDGYTPNEDAIFDAIKSGIANEWPDAEIEYQTLQIGYRQGNEWSQGWVDGEPVHDRIHEIVQGIDWSDENLYVAPEREWGDCLFDDVLYVGDGSDFEKDGCVFGVDIETGEVYYGKPGCGMSVYDQPDEIDVPDTPGSDGKQSEWGSWAEKCMEMIQAKLNGGDGMKTATSYRRAGSVPGCLILNSCDIGIAIVDGETCVTTWGRNLPEKSLDWCKKNGVEPVRIQQTIELIIPNEIAKQLTPIIDEFEKNKLALLTSELEDASRDEDDADRIEQLREQLKDFAWNALPAGFNGERSSDVEISCEDNLTSICDKAERLEGFIGDNGCAIERHDLGCVETWTLFSDLQRFEAEYAEYAESHDEEEQEDDE